MAPGVSAAVAQQVYDYFHATVASE